MGKKEEPVNMWIYQPTWKKAKWWILGGIIWAICSAPILFFEHYFYYLISGLIFWVKLTLPVYWSVGLLSLFWSFESQTREIVVPSIILSIPLGGLAGYIMWVLFSDKY